MARSGQVESISVVLARRAVEAADVAVVVIDATEGATEQDGAIAGAADKAGCGIIVAANKWDLVKGSAPDVAKTFDEALRRRLKFLDYAPVLHISAATGERTDVRPALTLTVLEMVILKAARVQDMEGEDFPQATDFRQDDDFFYLTGLETPNAWLVLVAHSNGADQVRVGDTYGDLSLRQCGQPDPNHPGYTPCNFVFDGDCTAQCAPNGDHYSSCVDAGGNTQTEVQFAPMPTNGPGESCSVCHGPHAFPSQVRITRSP